MDEFLKEYLHRGFGQMNKSEIEAWIFHALMKQTHYSGMTDFLLSSELRVSEAKIKNLRYNDALLFKDRVELFEDMRKMILNAQFRYDGKKIMFSLPNKMAQQLLREELYKKGHIYDTSFVSDNVVLFPEDLEDIIDIVYDDKDKNTLMTKLHTTKTAPFSVKLKETLDKIYKPANKIVTFSIEVLKLISLLNN